jgi:PII-like signaling protein
MNSGLQPATKLTVFIGGDERRDHRPLHSVVMQLLRDAGIAGATASKGVMSYGRRRQVHSSFNEVTMENLPIMIEAIDDRVKIEAVAARIAGLLGEHGLVELRPTSTFAGRRLDTC